MELCLVVVLFLFMVLVPLERRIGLAFSPLSRITQSYLGVADVVVIIVVAVAAFEVVQHDNDDIGIRKQHHN